jgi:hypothetical protein
MKRQFDNSALLPTGAKPVPARAIKQKDGNTCAMYLRPIPKFLRNFFVAECAINGVSRRWAILAFMRHSKRLIPKLKQLERDRKKNREE